MKLQDLKQFDYIRWYANRIFKSWDTFGQVVRITEKSAVIKTFDDFEETEIGVGGDAIKDEITIARKEDAIRFMEKRRISLIAEKSNIELDAKNKIKEIDGQIELLITHLK